MSQDERYDIVIVGGGPNGTTAAAYLAKSGLSVCVLEERTEAGGGCENTEVVPGVRIDPHAIILYGAAAPGFDQLELWKYGFRMYRDSGSPADALRRMAAGGQMTTQGRVQSTQKDLMGWGKITGMLGQPSFTRELLRSVFWCPPHPAEVEVTADNIPFMQVYKERAPDIWTEELLEMTMFDLLDEHMETEPPKVSHAFTAWYSGAAPHWEGVAIPSMASIALLHYSSMSGAQRVRGDMHDYFHSIIRCAIAHGAIFRTCCPVDEILIRDGRAVGVRLRDNAAWGEKTIWADKAVISATDIKQTFLDLIGPQHLDTGFTQKINDVSIKGGSIYVSHFLFKGLPRFQPLFDMDGWESNAGGGVYPMDSRELFYQHLMDIDGLKGNPTIPPEQMMWIARTLTNVPEVCTIPDHYLVSPFYMIVPPPDYHTDSPDALNKQKDKWDAYVRQAYGQVVDTSNMVAQWSNTPYDAEHRNTGLLGGNWMATRHCRDQFGQNRPYTLLPELSRYRTQIDGLYLCHQSSCHPGGLCLMAVPYNLMHILIEDGVAEPGDWWYPSPWYIPEQGKKSAIPG